MHIVPISFARLGGRLTGRLAYRVLPRRRRIGMSNLNRAYGDSLTQSEKAAILKGSFENFGITMAEFSAALETVLSPNSLARLKQCVVRS